jgi:GNAT superfamily N-acetyltransferase
VNIEFYPLTPDRWRDLEELFGERGACGGCWCMWWRLSRAEFQKQKGLRNKRAFHQIVKHGPPPGLLGYSNGRPIAWCALAPRESYPTLERSRILKPVDERPVWSVVCLFVAKSFRKSGVSVRMLAAAADYAHKQGARIIEGYPVEPRGPMADVFVYTGLASAFRKAGFDEATRRSKTRPIMRRRFRDSRTGRSGRAG